MNSYYHKGSIALENEGIVTYSTNSESKLNFVYQIN